MSQLRFATVVSVVFFASAALCSGQTIHLPPVFRPVLPKDEVVLTLRAKECSDEIIAIGVQNGQLVVARKKSTDKIALGNREISDVLNDLQTKYGDYLTDIDSQYRLFSASYLAETPPIGLACLDRTALQQALDVAIATAAKAKENADEAATTLTNTSGPVRAQVLAAKQQLDDAKRAADAAVDAARQRLTYNGPLLRILANSGQPDVTINFGVVMSPLSNATTTSTNASPAITNPGLLSGAGFQLDLIGTHLIARPTSRHRGRPSIYGQARFGLHANQELNVGRGETAKTDAASQIQTAIEQAQEVAVTAQFPLAWSLIDDHVDVIASPTFGVTWNTIDAFSFPSVRVGGVAKTLESLFDADRVSLATKELSRTLPLTEFGAQLMFHVRRGENTVFYLGYGIGRKQMPQRTIEFQVPGEVTATPPSRSRPEDATTLGNAVPRFVCKAECPAVTNLPASNSLKATFATTYASIGQLIFGWRMAGILDLRIDAIGPFDRANFGDPLLRVVIGKTFPIRAQ